MRMDTMNDNWADLPAPVSYDSVDKAIADLVCALVLEDSQALGAQVIDYHKVPFIAILGAGLDSTLLIRH